MTREEKLHIAEQIKDYLCAGNPIWDIDMIAETMDTAIEALQEQKIGRWIPWKAYYGKDRKSWSDELKCSECGYKWGDEEYKFCPMCGVKMEAQND